MNQSVKEQYQYDESWCFCNVNHSWRTLVVKGLKSVTLGTYTIATEKQKRFTNKWLDSWQDYAEKVECRWGFSRGLLETDKSLFHCWLCHRWITVVLMTRNCSMTENLVWTYVVKHSLISWKLKPRKIEQVIKLILHFGFCSIF